MRKSIFAKIGAAAVVLTLVTSSLVGGDVCKVCDENFRYSKSESGRLASRI